MDFSTAALLFLAAVCLHNLEEAIWLPDWLRRHPAPVVSAEPMRFRLAVVSVTLLIAGVSAAAFYRSSLAANLMAGVAVAMMLNAIVHLALTFRACALMPGTASGLAAVIPAGALLIQRGLAEGRFTGSSLWPFLVATPIALLAITYLLVRGIR